MARDFQELEKALHDDLAKVDEELEKCCFIEAQKYLKSTMDLLAVANAHDVAAIPQSKIFACLFFFLNYENINPKQAYKKVMSISKSIDSWTYDREGRELEYLADAFDKEELTITEEEIDNHFKSLRIPLDFKNYALKFVFKLTAQFLDFKKRYKESKNNSINMTTQKAFLDSLAFSTQTPNPFSKIELFKQIDRTPEDVYRNSDFYLSTRSVLSIYDKFITNETSAMRSLKEVQKYLKEVKQYIRTIKPEEFIAVKPEWHQHVTSDVLERAYDLINDNLNNIRESQLQEEASLDAIINASPLTNLLYKNGIDPKSIPEEKLNELENIKDISFILNFLIELKISLEEALTIYYDALIMLNKDKISEIKTLLTQHALKKHTIRAKIISIFTDDYNRILTNYSIIKDLVDFNSMFYEDDILFVDPKEIKLRLSILSKYHLNKSNFIYLLTHFEFLPIYDLIIEQGIEPYLLVGITHTENPINTIKRIIVYKRLKEEYVTPSHTLKKEIRESHKSFILDSELDTMVPNSIPSYINISIPNIDLTNAEDNETIKLMDEKYKLNDLYRINGVRISRPKFIRYYLATGNVMLSLIEGTILSEEEYRSVLKEFDSNPRKLVK